MTAEEKMKVVEQVSMVGLEKALSEKFGLKIELKHEIRKDRHEAPYLHVASQDISSHCGVMSELMKKVVLRTFNSSVGKDEESGEPFAWMSIYADYETVSGSNGIEVCSVWYKPSNESWYVRWRGKDELIEYKYRSN